MREKIQDEFAHLPVSRQRKYQLRMQRDGRCTECGEPAVYGSRCITHLVAARERQRKKRGLKRRYLNTLSYQLQTQPAVVAQMAARLKSLQKGGMVAQEAPKQPAERTSPDSSGQER